MTAATAGTDTGLKEQSLWSRLTDRWIVKLILLVIVIAWLVPTLGVLISSFRPAGLVNATGWWTVFADLGSNEWTLENYSDVLTSEGFGNAFLNSLAVTIPSTVIPITIAAFAAYAFAWMEFPGRQWIFVSVIANLSASQLHRLSAYVLDGVGAYRRCDPLRDLHETGCSTFCPGAGIVRHLPVPVGVE